MPKHFETAKIKTEKIVDIFLGWSTILNNLSEMQNIQQSLLPISNNQYYWYTNSNISKRNPVTSTSEHKLFPPKLWNVWLRLWSTDRKSKTWRDFVNNNKKINFLNEIWLKVLLLTISDYLKIFLTISILLTISDFFKDYFRLLQAISD